MSAGTNPLLAVRPLVIGHRGNPVAFAENTIESFQSAVDLGADAIELDVRMSHDGIPVIIHDATLDRTTNATGRVDALDWRELEALDAATNAPTRREGRLKIPTLEHVLDRFRGMPLIIEVKELSAASITEELVRQFDAQGRVLIGSPESLVSERFYRSGLATCASMKDALFLIPLALAGIAPSRPDFEVLSIPPTYRGLPIPVQRMAASVKSFAIPTHVWTVNDPAAAARFWQDGVSGIVTDDPAAILRARRG